MYIKKNLETYTPAINSGYPWKRIQIFRRLGILKFNYMFLWVIWILSNMKIPLLKFNDWNKYYF